MWPAMYFVGRGAAAFSGRAEHGAPGDSSDGYPVCLQPKVLAFEYGYPQLKNPGFAIIPEAGMTETAPQQGWLAMWSWAD